MAKLLNYLALQAGWFACVLGAAHGRPWIGIVTAVALLAAHLATHPRPARETLVVLCVAPLGFAVDSLQQALGWIHYQGTPLLGVLAPVWIGALWLLFPITFHGSLGWLLGRPWLAALLGFLGGPLGYLGGEQLGALGLGAERWSSLLGLGCAWALAVPLALWIAARIDRAVRPPAVRCTHPA